MMILEGNYCKDCKIFIDDVEESAMELIRSSLNNPAFEHSKIRIMPDVHAGIGSCIGFTATVGPFINPSHIGVDIGCAIDTCFTSAPADQADLIRLERDIRKSVKFGQEYHKNALTTPREFCRYAQGLMNAWRSSWPEMVQDVRITEKFISNMCARIGQDEKVFWKSLGTVGSGNHFVEVGLNPKDGCLAYTIHCGSRNFGARIAKHHEKIASRDLSRKDLEKEIKELAFRLKSEGRQTEIPGAIDELVSESKKISSGSCPAGYLSGSLMSDYLTDMCVGVAYSLHNHDVISNLVFNAIKRQFPSVRLTDMVRSVHNYVDCFDRIIRKGAISAREGDRCVIPFNMRDGVAICFGKSNEDWNCSAPHGAGRAMSRAAARKSLSVNEFRKQMSGIVSTSVGPETIDEAPSAYKDTSFISSLIGDTVDISFVVKPLINLKNKNSSEKQIEK